jgi:hypothetical protein
MVNPCLASRLAVTTFRIACSTDASGRTVLFASQVSMSHLRHIRFFLGGVIGRGKVLAFACASFVQSRIVSGFFPKYAATSLMFMNMVDLSCFQK